MSSFTTKLPSFDCWKNRCRSCTSRGLKNEEIVPTTPTKERHPERSMLNDLSSGSSIEIKWLQFVNASVAMLLTLCGILPCDKEWQ
eukprot:scaffold10635_cov153-Cylindrotheca_fusiformis.AAC.1